MRDSILDAERLSLKAAAERLGVHVTTVWRWATDGVNGRKLPTIRVGGRRFVMRTDLDTFLAEGQIECRDGRTTPAPDASSDGNGGTDD